MTECFYCGSRYVNFTGFCFTCRRTQPRFSRGGERIVCEICGSEFNFDKENPSTICPYCILKRNFEKEFTLENAIDILKTEKKRVVAILARFVQIGKLKKVRRGVYQF